MEFIQDLPLEAEVFKILFPTTFNVVFPDGARAGAPMISMIDVGFVVSKIPMRKTKNSGLNFGEQMGSPLMRRGVVRG